MNLRLVIFVSILVSCGPNPESANNPSSSALTLDQQAVMLLTNRCSACHGPDSPGRAGVDFINDPGQLVDRGLVIPGRPEASPLYLAVQSDRMPQTGPLTAQEKDLLRRWILEL
ncbi:MAG TPA: c-type cytochrome domain-containing protein [Bdellovibrionales bacterium]|nr:c-type cytochrome domain-containing protein [Bdellovibrionales bacterium]